MFNTLEISHCNVSLPKKSSWIFLLLIPVHELAWYWWHQAHSRPPWSTPLTTRSCPDGTSWSRAPGETYKGGRIANSGHLLLKPVILSVSADAFPCVRSDEVDLKLSLTQSVRVFWEIPWCNWGISRVFWEIPWCNWKHIATTTLVALTPCVVVDGDGESYKQTFQFFIQLSVTNNSSSSSVWPTTHHPAQCDQQLFIQLSVSNNSSSSSVWATTLHPAQSDQIWTKNDREFLPSKLLVERTSIIKYDSKWFYGLMFFYVTLKHDLFCWQKHCFAVSQFGNLTRFQWSILGAI